MPQFDTTIAALSGNWPEKDRRRNEYDVDACLVVIQGRKPGHIYPIDESSLRLGRDSSADIVLDDPSVSRHQALIELHDEEVHLVDGGSTNGTFINGNRISKGERVKLERQDLIYVGDTELKFLPKGDRDAYYLRAIALRASLDGLTQIYNKGYLLEAMETHFSRAKSHDTAMSLMVIDLDKFKLINDSLGHDVGDQVLIHTAKLASQVLDSSEVVFGRFGGEEFLALLPGFSLFEAVDLAEVLRETLSSIPPMLDGRPVQVTASIGVAAMDASTPDVQALFRRADQAVYKAKEGGRNRVETVG